MRRVVVIFTTLVVFSTSGCFTYRDKVAYRRAELTLTDRGVKGDELAAAVGLEVAEANQDTGACEVAETEVELTPAAATENAEGIRKAREGRSAILALAGKAWTWAAGQWPWLGILGTAGAGALALWKRLAAYRKTAEALIEGVGSVANKNTKSAIRNLAIDYGLQPFLDKLVQRVDPPKA
jgi:hypothetical protein